MGLVIWTLVKTGDTTAYSLLLVASFQPLGLSAGPLVDRWNRRHVDERGIGLTYVVVGAVGIGFAWLTMSNPENSALGGSDAVEPPSGPAATAS